MLYLVLKSYTKLCHRLYYRDIQVVGKENLPKRGGFVLAPNHQNALMDALAVIFSSGTHPLFLSRADIFKHPLANRFLRSIRILPVYRIKDGRKAMNGNEAIFQFSIEELRKSKPIALFPEGTHGSGIRLLPLKNGLGRIVVRALKEYPEIGDTPVIPVGIHYSNPSGFYGDLYIRFGPPLSSMTFLKTHSEDTKLTVQHLTQTLENELKKEIYHIENEENQIFIQALFPFVETLMAQSPKLTESQKKGMKNLEVRHHIIQSLNHVFSQHPEAGIHWLKKCQDFRDELEERGLGAPSLPYLTPKWKPLHFIITSSACLVLSIPAIFGWIAHFLPSFLVQRWILFKVSDPQFQSSFLFVSQAVLLPVFYLVIAGIAGWAAGWGMALSMLFLLPVSGALWVIFRRLLDQWQAQWSVFKQTNRKQRLNISGRITQLLKESPL
jgi:1-acyl-sn-glycerol-3-phosphate acyltransferase